MSTKDPISPSHPHIKTPIRGSPFVSINLSLGSIPLGLSERKEAFKAAALPCTTLSHTFIGALAVPQTNMPGMFVSSGFVKLVSKYPYLSVFNPAISASLCIAVEGRRPTARTTISRSNLSTVPLARFSNFTVRDPFSGITSGTLDLMYFTPYLSFISSTNSSSLPNTLKSR